MWSNFMESAKTMAADFDQKLNESVGMDNDGKPLDSNTTTPKKVVPSATPAIATLQTPVAAGPPDTSLVTKISEEVGGDDDAWNDDFDFDDGDLGDAPKEETPPPEPVKKSPPVPQTIPPKETKASVDSPASPAPTPLTKAAAPAKPVTAEPAAKTPATEEPIPISPKPTPVAKEPAPKPPSEPSAPASKASVAASSPSPATSKEPPQNAGSAIASGLFSVVGQITTAASAVEALGTSQDETIDNAGWDGDDDLDIDVGDEEGGDVEDATTKAKDDSKNAGHSPPDKSVVDSESTPKTETATPACEDAVVSAVVDSLKDDVTSAITPAAATSTATVPETPFFTPNATAATPTAIGGGVFSNLSNLTKTADAFLTPEETTEKTVKDSVATSPTATTSDAAKSEPPEEDATAKESVTAPTVSVTASTKKSDPAPPPAATPKPKASLPVPKFTPGGGLFSNLKNIAKTADSLITAAVEKSDDVGIVETSNPVDSGGWDEDNDDDFFDDDDNDVAESKTKDPSNASVSSAEKGKTEVSTNSFIEVSPTSSISTPEILPKKDSIPQPEHMEKASSGPLNSTQPEKTAVSPSAPALPVTTNIEDDPRFQKLQESLRLREEQLIDKGRQLNELQLLLESRDEQHKKKLLDTKEEAKKRILRAKERCEAAEAKLQARSAGDSDDMKKKQSIIDELMEEGQALAKKQSVMERAVRDANLESRAIAEELRKETHEKQTALNKVQELETLCKNLKDNLTSARKGESQAGKLEGELLSARADAEEKGSTILSLQQTLKELQAESKDLKQEIDNTRKSAAHVAQQEKTSMRREHNDLIGDLEQKLRTTEREAGVREDALRHEVSEIRKRWQDAVRRADALSMDIQSSTAPLLRQLESMERQSRLRASNAAELESRLRSELEEATIENERLGKNYGDFKSKLSKLERSIKDRDNELSKAKSTVEEQARDIEDLREKEEKLKTEAEMRQAEFERVERLANEGVARVRSEMTQTVTDSEERYRGQIDKLQSELKTELEKRSQLEAQVSQLLESGGLFGGQPSAPTVAPIRRESKPKKLHKAEGQAEILAGALGLGDDSDDESDSDDDDDVFDRSDEDGSAKGNSSGAGNVGFHSFAAIEQLSSKLKTAEVELQSMRKSLKESEKVKQSLVEELGEARHAKEKLPLFEARVEELTRENTELEMEIAGLKEDVADVRELYRTQLNVLLEEKTASVAAASGSSDTRADSVPTEEEKLQAPENPTTSDTKNNDGFDDDW